MHRYIPPHLKQKLASREGAAEQRTLDLEHHVPQVKLVLPRGAQFDTAACPLDLEEGNPDECQSEGCTVYTVFHTDKLQDELLEWFKASFGECSARFEFPSDLSKAERAKWHHLAQRKKLHTESHGVGDDRFLSISSRPPPEEGEAAETLTHALHLSRAQRHQAQQIYDFCQLEGGRFWNYSKGELEELVSSGQPLPEDLAEMVDRRKNGAKVSQLLRQGEPDKALQMVFDNPKLAWQKDEHSGGYPIHIATFKGYHTVVEYLASLPNVIEQRDGQRETPLAIAMRRGNVEMQKLLLAAGADPQHAAFHRDPAGGSKAQPGHGSGSCEEGKDKEEEYMSWDRTGRRAYKHGGEGGAGCRRRSLDGGADLQHSSTDGKDGSKGSNGRRRQAEFPPHPTHCPW